MNFNGKVAFITGASSGIGYQLAMCLHNEGANLILVARRKDRLIELTEKLNNIRANSVQYLEIDLSTLEDNLELQKKLTEYNIDILINNAGFGLYGNFHESELSKNLEMINTNISATLVLMGIFIPQFINKKAGTIVSLSSVIGTLPAPLMSTYCATKAFNLYHSLALREELKSHGINVVVIRPGPTTSEFGQVAGVSTLDTFFGDTAESCAKKIIASIKSNRAQTFTGPGTWLMSFLSTFWPLPLLTKIVGYTLNRVKNVKT